MIQYPPTMEPGNGKSKKNVMRKPSTDVEMGPFASAHLRTDYRISKRAGRVSEAVAPKSPGSRLSKHCSPAPKYV
jgi:hypothetical protein